MPGQPQTVEPETRRAVDNGGRFRSCSSDLANTHSPARSPALNWAIRQIIELSPAGEHAHPMGSESANGGNGSRNWDGLLGYGGGQFSRGMATGGFSASCAGTLFGH